MLVEVCTRYFLHIANHNTAICLRGSYSAEMHINIHKDIVLQAHQRTCQSLWVVTQPTHLTQVAK